MAGLRRINQEDLRNHNLSVVLDTLLQSSGPLSRAELAKATGLTKATMSLLASMLIDNHVVVEGEAAMQSSYGRPSTPLAVAPGTWAGIGLQINTDGYGYIVLDLTGRVVAQEWMDASLNGCDPEEAFDRLDALVGPTERELKGLGYHVVGTGLALPGLVTDDQRLLSAPNLDWDMVDLREFDLVDRLHVTADNEANLAALAQIPGYATCRGGQPSPIDAGGSFLYVSTDVGIGGALVRDGRVVTGDHGFGGEIGHLSVALDGPACRCGRRGCLEAYAGRRAMVEAAGIASGESAARPGAAIELYERWRAGDEAAVEAIDRAVQALGSAISSTINLMDSQTVILGGFWQHFGDDLAERLTKTVAKQVLAGRELAMQVVMPPVGERPALRGAAEVGLRRFIDNPLGYIAAE
ncbi:ROK family transcriptional regulator [Bifidobacterium avesanii]|uniref:ROK family protein n=1 Tax=Bifidobacterium avesanii TaxID=1798157 RepID=A0A7K3TIC1_9BIFI|nr:ROK family transcriptional regulator [Bifidobacterium avesanii]KAB8287154.1 ROK family protein [Bifidobacterium avesanii]NEG78013.1 ROK family protein [Bifidobacterium avesanii]